MLARCKELENLQRTGYWIHSNGLFFWILRQLENRLCMLIQRYFSRRRPDRDGEGLGSRGERVAAKFLQRLGYRILERSHLQRLGEIDLIAVDGRCIVFVEVKTWSTVEQGDPADAVDHRKQERLTRAALIYLKKRRLLEQPARFDVISVVWPAHARAKPQIRHFINAFEAVGKRDMYR
jgi:putative endonuclease